MPKNPVVASYVADFLKIDQLHVYRQLTGLRNDFDMHVFTHKRENEAHFPYHDKWLHVLPKPKLRWWRRFVHRQLRQEPWQIYRSELRRWILDLARLDASLLHIYFGHVAPHFLPLMKAWPKPVVVSFHGADAGIDMEKPRYFAALQEVFRHATRIQSRSLALNADLIRLGCPEEKIVLQRTGIPLADWPFIERTDPADGAWLLVQSCRFIEKKGLDLTIAAFAEIAAEHPQARLALVGRGPLQATLEAQVTALGLSARVDFPGFCPQAKLREWVERAHVYLHPSRTGADGNREGVPNAMLEAMASGVPVIATHHGGIPEAITDGEGGLLVPENDASALAAAMRRVLSDQALRRRLAHGGRRAVEQDFDRAKQDEHLRTFYKSLMPDAVRSV